MASPEDKDRHRKRIRSRLKRDLKSTSYRQRIVEDKTKKIELKDLSHSDLVKLIQEEDLGS